MAANKGTEKAICCLLMCTSWGLSFPDIITGRNPVTRSSRVQLYREWHYGPVVWCRGMQKYSEHEKLLFTEM